MLYLSSNVQLVIIRWKAGDQLFISEIVYFHTITAFKTISIAAFNIYNGAIRNEEAAPEIRVHFSGRLQYTAQHICITNYPSNTPGEIVNIRLTIQKTFHFNSVQQGSHSRHTLHAESYNRLTLTE